MYSYQDQVILAFVDGAGEHGAVMECENAIKFAESIMRAIESAYAFEWEEKDVN